MGDKTYTTASGKVLTESDLDAIADEVEHAEFDVRVLTQRRRGRPAMGSAQAAVVPVRIDPELRAALEARAAADHSSTSDLIRAALRRFLDVA